jgi:hypothetical protein
MAQNFNLGELGQYLTLNIATSNLTVNTSTFGITGIVDTTAANMQNQTLTFSSPNTIWNAASGQIAYLTLTGNTTVTVTNPKVQTYILHAIQDSTGSRTITWGSNFKWPAGAAPALTTTAGARDIISFVSDGTNMYGSFLPNVK